MTLMFGNTPVPYTSAWSAEESFYVGRCPHARRTAICQAVQPGGGKPIFGKPHSQRQREAIIDGLCDICGRTLKNRTKVSLSHADINAKGARGPCIMQVEPLLHRECAAQSLAFCPSLRKDIRIGALKVRAVTRYVVQLAYIGPEFVAEYVPGYRARPTDQIVGHAKVELVSWADRDEAWLQVAA